MDQPELPGFDYEDYSTRRRREQRERTLIRIKEYDPDENPHVYGSYVPNRTSQHFKVHTSLRNARSATTSDMGGIYKRIAGHWELLEIRQQGQIIEEFE